MAKELSVDRQILNMVGHRTKAALETMSETICLHQRGFLFSQDFSRIMVPIFNDFSIKDIIENINLLSYLYSKYNSEIYLVIDKRNKIKLNYVYYLFDHLVVKIIEIKRYVALLDLLKSLNITKIVYNKSSQSYDDFNYYLDLSLSAPIEMNLNKIIDGVNITYTGNSTISYQPNNSTLNVNVSKLFNGEVQFIKLSATNDILTNLRIVLSTDAYLFNGKMDVLDYLIPFSGMKIISNNTNFYSQPIFVHSSSISNKNTFKSSIK
jgi:hypothetical protein